METFFERLKSLISTHSGDKHTVFAKKAGIPAGTFQRYMDGKVPKAEHLIRISETYNASIDWLLVGRGSTYIMDENPDIGEIQIDTDLLTDIIEVVDKVMDKEGIVLDPGKKARFIALQYELYLETGKEADQAKMARHLKLVA